MSGESHPYTQLQRNMNENNDYLPPISNWKNIETFILPKEYITRDFDSVQDQIEKEFKDRGMRNKL